MAIAMTCPDCGAEFRGWKFCPECGTRVGPEEQVLMEIRVGIHWRKLVSSILASACGLVAGGALFWVTVGLVTLAAPEGWKVLDGWNVFLVALAIFAIGLVLGLVVTTRCKVWPGWLLLSTIASGLFWASLILLALASYEGS